MLAAGRVPFERHVGELPPVALVRWLELRWNGLHILGAHLPSANDKAPLSTEQAPFWAWLETYLATQLDQPAVLIGDLSTDRAESGLACAASFDRVEASGWTDLVRKHTDAEDVASFWLHSGKTHTGYLIDHTLATPSFAAVESAGVPMSLGEHEFVRSARREWVVGPRSGRGGYSSGLSRAPPPLVWRPAQPSVFLFEGALPEKRPCFLSSRPRGTGAPSDGSVD